MSTEVTTIEDTASRRRRWKPCIGIIAGTFRNAVGRSGRVLSMRDLMDFQLARQTEELHHMKAYIHGAA